MVSLCFRWVFCGVVFLWLGTGAVLARPNIVLILVDDLGFGDLSSYGAEDLRTPHIDALVADGIRSDTFYANCPVCSPTRASLVTGRYPDVVGVPGVIRTHAANNWGFMDPAAVTLPEMLRRAGYHTGMSGKWHLGLELPNTPTGRGFDWFRGWLGDMMDDYYTHERHGINYLRENDHAIAPEGHATDLFSDWAIEYLSERAQSPAPFFLYLAYNAPHTPIQPPEEWFRRVKDREAGISDRRARLAALIEHMDDGIGRVVAALQSLELYDETLVIFTSDNGGQSNVGANNGATRAGKGTMYEGGLRVPFCAVWKDGIAAGSSTSVAGMTMDLYPTLCEAAGLTVDHKIDGVSLWRNWLGEQETVGERDLYWVRREGGNGYMGLTAAAYRSGPWKLVHNSPFEPMELYHLGEDPLEALDRAREDRSVFNRLAARLRLQYQRAGRVPWQSPR